MTAISLHTSRGNTATQTDFILFRRTMRKLVTDVKVIPCEEVALQHQLLVCDMRTDVPPKSKRKFFLRLKVWKLKEDSQTSNHFQEVSNLHVSTCAGAADAATEKLSGTSSRLDCSRQLRRCVAQLGPTVGVVE